MRELTRPADMAPIKGRRPVLSNCRIDELQVDPSYQRALNNDSAKRIRSMARDWSWALCQPLVVAHRGDGALFVVDGQHRRAAAELRGDILDLPCVIVEFGSVSAEAESFVALNTTRRALSTVAVYRAAIAAADPAAIAIDRLVARHNLRITGNTSASTLKAGQLMIIGQMQIYLRQHGETALDRALEVYSAAFGDEVPRYQGTLFTAIAYYLAQVDGYRATAPKLIEGLRSIGQVKLFARIHDKAIQTGLGQRNCGIAVIRDLVDAQRPMTPAPLTASEACKSAGGGKRLANLRPTRSSSPASPPAHRSARRW